MSETWKSKTCVEFQMELYNIHKQQSRYDDAHFLGRTSFTQSFYSLYIAPLPSCYSSAINLWTKLASWPWLKLCLALIFRSFPMCMWKGLIHEWTCHHICSWSGIKFSLWCHQVGLRWKQIVTQIMNVYECSGTNIFMRGKMKHFIFHLMKIFVPLHEWKNIHYSFYITAK